MEIYGRTIKPRYVHVTGPAIRSNNGIKITIWYVDICSESEMTLKSYPCRSYEKAADLGYKISDDRNLALIFEAIHA